jgi:lysophospholipase L1-like esterase
MIYPLIVFLLSPVLILQGIYVRRNTAQLPEPLGERSGIVGSGPALRLLILGDSAAAGVGVNEQSEALSGQLIEQLSNDFQLTWQLWAKNGQRSKDIFHLLTQQKQNAFDVVLISIGVNDVTGGLSLKKWLSHSHQIIALLETKFSAGQIIFTALPPMHLFPALPQPLRWVFGFRAKQFNRALRAMLENQQQCNLLTVTTPLQADHIAVDGFHPNARTYALWAQQASTAINQAL